MIFCTTINFFIVRYEKKIPPLRWRITLQKKKLHSFSPYFFVCAPSLSPIFILWQKHEKQFCMFPTFIVFDLWESFVASNKCFSFISFCAIFHLPKNGARFLDAICRRHEYDVCWMCVNVQREFFITVLKYITLIWCTLTHVFNDKVRFENKPKRREG